MLYQSASRFLSAFFKFYIIFLVDFFVILSIHKPSLGSCEVPKKSGPDQFSFFESYWSQTN